MLPQDTTTAAESFEVLLEFADCSSSPKYSTSSAPVGFPGPRSGVKFDYTMRADTTSCIPPGQGIRSEEGTTATQITFVMNATGTAQVFWLDYSGGRVLYATLSSGRSLPQATFLTHPWVVVGDDGECLGFIVSTKASQTLRVN